MLAVFYDLFASLFLFSALGAQGSARRRRASSGNLELHPFGGTPRAPSENRRPALTIFCGPRPSQGSCRLT